MRLLKVYFISLLMFTGFQSFAQSSLTVLKENLPFSKSLTLSVKPHTLYTNLTPNFTYTSLSVTFENDLINNAYIFLGSSQKENLKLDEHVDGFQSGLIIAKESQNLFSFFSGQLEGKVIFNFLHSPPLTPPLKKKGQEDVSSEGNRPSSIDQSVWREGLPDPKPNPDTHQVYHTIIHHSAGSNSDTNFINVVRNIYLYHTQTNGWDDIGYNFLISQNGQIFDGRDAQGVADEDNIKGAHLCGKNNNTMGVCLLGNYETATPSDTMLRSLVALFSWKFNKEKLSPFDYFQHPRNTPNAGYLPAMAGHRDGCSTLCPGENMFNLIGELKEEVCLKMDSCAIPIASNQINTEETASIFPNPTTDKIYITSDKSINSITLFSATGKLILSEKNSLEISLKDLPSGIYFIKVKTDDGHFLKTIIKKN